MERESFDKPLVIHWDAPDLVLRDLDNTLILRDPSIYRCTEVSGNKPVGWVERALESSNTSQCDERLPVAESTDRKWLKPNQTRVSTTSWEPYNDRVSTSC